MSVILNGDRLYIAIDDEIVDSWYYGISASSIKYGIDQNRGQFSGVDLYVNTPGGDVNEAIAIRNELLKLVEDGIPVIPEIGSLAASSGTLIALSGSEKPKMRVGSYFMIHNPFTWSGGTAQDFYNMYMTLKTFQEDIITIYENSSNLKREDISKYMDAETWFSAEEANRFNFAEMVIDNGKNAILNKIDTVNTPVMAKYRNVPECLKSSINSNRNRQPETDGGVTMSKFSDMLGDPESKADFQNAITAAVQSAVQNSVKSQGSETPTDSGTPQATAGSGILLKASDDDIKQMRVIASNTKYPKALRDAAFDAAVSCSVLDANVVKSGAMSFDMNAEKEGSEEAQEETSETEETPPTEAPEEGDGTIKNLADLKKLEG